MAVGAAMGLAVAVLVGASVVRLGHQTTRTQSVFGVAPSVTPATMSLSHVQPVTAAPPEVFVMDLPIPAAALTERHPAATPHQAAPPTRNQATSARSTPAEHSSCRPPYIVDPQTSKKHWKLECL
jgi:hypothetical protein